MTTEKGPWRLLALAAVLALSAFSNLFRLTSEGYGNLYYAAAVKNILTGWHDFFFASFDAGFVSVDKPPLGFWIQAASAYLFGFHGWSLLLPQALAGVLSVGLVYHLVNRSFGPVAGLLAALALALTPISIATNRNNNLESLLILALLLAAWAFVVAAERGSLGWLLLGAAAVGVGFNIKMLQAFMVLPAFYLMYLLCARTRWWRRFLHLGIATAVLLAVSLSWAVAVDLTPEEGRPYVGSSQNNSALNLAYDSNGKRLMQVSGLRTLTRGALEDQPTPKPGRRATIGEPEPLRLLNQQLGDQIGWLLPLAVVGLAAASWQERPRLPHQALVLWGTWFVALGAFFTAARLFSPYYLAMLAPAVAALAGIGTVALWNDYRSSPGGWRGWLLPLTLAGTAGAQAYVLAHYPGWGYWMALAVAVLCLAAVAGLVGARLSPRPKTRGYPLVAASVGVLSLLLAPSIWVANEAWYGGNETRSPRAAPPVVLLGAFEGGGVPPLPAAEDPALTDYLLANRGGAEYLVGVAAGMDAAPIILRTDEPVVSLGGFGGKDPVFGTGELANLVGEGAVRFFLMQENESTSWVQDNCEQVPRESWQSSTSEQREALLLYDCGAGAR